MDDYESFTAAVLATEITEDGPFSALTTNVSSLFAYDMSLSMITKQYFPGFHVTELSENYSEEFEFGRCTELSLSMPCVESSFHRVSNFHRQAFRYDHSTLLANTPIGSIVSAASCYENHDRRSFSSFRSVHTYYLARTTALSRRGESPSFPGRSFVLRETKLSLCFPMDRNSQV